MKTYEEFLNESETKEYRLLVFDNEDPEDITEQLTDVLKNLNINIYFYTIPGTEGDSTYSFIVSKTKLSKKELKDIAKEEDIID